MIEITDLGFSYGSKSVLENISMTLEPSKIYGLLGENGVGKTTLLTLLCGLKKPLHGAILADGVAPWKRTPAFLEEICYLPDEVAPLPSTASKWAEAEGKFRPNYDAAKFASIIEELETDPSQKMNSMSAGQLKKCYIAFALAAGTRYLLLDEPTNGLDIPSKAQFRSALMKYTREDSIIVISTHQVRDLENIIDPIVILDRRDVLLNASLDRIGEKLYFDYGRELHDDSLYSEQLPGGFIQVRPNTGGKPSKVNVEALFNAVHGNKELIKAIFSNE